MKDIRATFRFKYVCIRQRLLRDYGYYFKQFISAYRCRDSFKITWFRDHIMILTNYMGYVGVDESVLKKAFYLTERMLEIDVLRMKARDIQYIADSNERIVKKSWEKEKDGYEEA